MRQVTRRAFSLVEILLVVMILGVLAAIVIPQFDGSTETTRDTSAAATLQELRGQIEVFKTQHGNSPPQQGSLWTILQTASGTNELTAPTTGSNFGPYFSANPVNPWNGLTAASSNATDTSAGWFYTATTTDYDLRVRNIDGSVNYNY